MRCRRLAFQYLPTPSLWLCIFQHCFQSHSASLFAIAKQFFKQKIKKKDNKIINNFFTNRITNPGQIEYSQRQAWTAVGVLTCLLFPAIVIVAVLVVCFKKKRKDEDASKSWRFSERGSGLDDKDSSIKPSPFVRSFGSSRSAVKNVAQVSPSRIRRSYEGVYLTHEPLPNRPNVEFEDKDWDLRRDYSSSSPSEAARNLDSPSKESDV